MRGLDEADCHNQIKEMFEIIESQLDAYIKGESSDKDSKEVKDICLYYLAYLEEKASGAE